MPINHKNILALLQYIQIDQFSIVCHFKCIDAQRSIVSKVPFEPYDGAIVISWKELLLHPIESYNRYYHTPITIYGSDTHDTLVLKAFEKVANHFRWNEAQNRYEYN